MARVPIPPGFFGKEFWLDKDKVIRYAIKLGPGQTVFKHPDRDNYNITHTERTEQYERDWIIYQT